MLFFGKNSILSVFYWSIFYLCKFYLKCILLIKIWLICLSPGPDGHLNPCNTLGMWYLVKQRSPRSNHMSFQGHQSPSNTYWKGMGACSLFFLFFYPPYVHIRDSECPKKIPSLKSGFCGSIVCDIFWNFENWSTGSLRKWVLIYRQ